MIGIAGLKPPGDRLRLIGTALALVSCWLAIIFIGIKYKIDLSRDALNFYFWAIAVSVVLGYLILRFILGKEKTDDLTSKVLEKFFARDR